MKIRRKIEFALAVALLAVGCATSGRVLPSAAELAGPRAGADALARGRSAYVRECAACHRMYWPDEYAPGAWERIAPEMADRAGLSGKEAAELTLFLTEASRATRVR